MSAHPTPSPAKWRARSTELGVGRFDLIYTVGPLPTGARLHAVELYGSKVIPMVRDILADQTDRSTDRPPADQTRSRP